jgi:hypothetical protein
MQHTVNGVPHLSWRAHLAVTAQLRDGRMSASAMAGGGAPLDRAGILIAAHTVCY